MSVVFLTSISAGDSSCAPALSAAKACWYEATAGEKAMSIAAAVLAAVFLKLSALGSDGAPIRKGETEAPALLLLLLLRRACTRTGGGGGYNNVRGKWCHALSPPPSPVRETPLQRSQNLLYVCSKPITVDNRHRGPTSSTREAEGFTTYIVMTPNAPPRSRMTLAYCCRYRGDRCRIQSFCVQKKGQRE